MKSFRFFYLCVLGIGYLAFLPFLFLLVFKQKYRNSLPARFFCQQKKPSKDTEIWLHACSFGEVKSLEPIICELLEKQKNILLTTTTQTGYVLAQKTFCQFANFQVLYLPFEIFLWRWKSSLLNLKTLVVTESELWYMPFFMAKDLGAKTLLINARVSDRSYDKYLKLQFYYREVFSFIDKVFAQSRNDEIRLESLGAKNIQVFGNLKVYSNIQTTKLYNKPSKLVVVAGSSHADEEKIVLKAFNVLHKKNPNSLLILAPRHPERFDEVCAMLEGFKVSRLSQDGMSDDSDIIVVDILGELNNIYRIADIVVLCGSFVKVGGHNPLEPAFFGAKLLSGPYIFNQYVLFDCVENYTIVQDAQELEKKLLDYENLPHSKIKVEKDCFKELMKEIMA
ncbi:lipid IV(A) 3-deoxy-D-manno-octulosonic acid transferase [Helicobacter anatolicus]|uniref:lipid IV(A) 3-deoxy-D-manno-octulosonic acid transferase n=1 Tax=Helicobacter anatolicus TaxID=2905874 RepID=UPI001E2F5A8D|nr:lipid IV(A) 3-deoxy-D-manno-octulosonic acid transferase [Helicobacter anatolicus]MCE3040007.1 lipid IV(A) 3-deoxy-D-manno-octulosonic acid transferase [Helicobacter anatolicus]